MAPSHAGPAAALHEVFWHAAAGVMAADIGQHVLPIVVVEDECSPAAFAPHWALMRRLAMDRFGGLIREPFGGVVDVAAGVWQSQVHVRCFDRECVDDQSAVGFCDAIAKRLGDGGHHFIGELHRRMGHAFGGHAVADFSRRGAMCAVRRSRFDRPRRRTKTRDLRRGARGRTRI